MNLLSNKSRKGRTFKFNPFLQLIINEWPFVSKTKKRLLNEVFKTATFTQVDIQSDFLVPYHHISIKHNRFYRVQKTIIRDLRPIRFYWSSKLTPCREARVKGVFDHFHFHFFFRPWFRVIVFFSMQSNRQKKKQKKKRQQQHRIELVKLVSRLVYKIWLMKRLPMIVSQNFSFLIHFDLFLIHR